MLVKNAENRGQLEFVSLENMVPQDHLLRKIDAAIDFKKIYEFVEDLYCEDNGRPSVDPVVLFKIVLIQHIYGIPSLRRTLEEVSMNLAYRWFIGYPLNEAVPHFSTVSYNFKHRFNHATVEYVFRWVLKAAAEEGYLDTEAIFVDGTHIKASANLKKQAKKAVPKQAKRYAKDKQRPGRTRQEALFRRQRQKSGPGRKGNGGIHHRPGKRRVSQGGTQKVLCLRGAHGLRQAQFCSWRSRHSRQCPRQRLGSAKGSSGAAAFFPLAIPVPRPKRTAIPGGCMCMTSTLMM